MLNLNFYYNLNISSFATFEHVLQIYDQLLQIYREDYQEEAFAGPAAARGKVGDGGGGLTPTLTFNFDFYFYI